MALKLLKYIGFGLTTIIIAVLLYLLVALVLSLTPDHPQIIDCQEKKPMFVASNGIHLDLILPRNMISKELLEPLNPPDWALYLAFGWGDKEFYINTPTWDDFKLPTAMRALFTNSQSAVHVVWLKNRSTDWPIVPLCPEQYVLLNQYLAETFATSSQEQLIEIDAAGYSSNDRFYQARGNFNFIQTCNSWVNQGLKTAHVKTAIWSPFDKGVLYQLNRGPWE